VIISFVKVIRRVLAGGKEVATDALDCFFMFSAWICAKSSGNLLNSHRDVRTDHGLEIAEAANHRAVIPWLFAR
jgi:hypothetical protein